LLWFGVRGGRWVSRAGTLEKMSHVAHPRCIPPVAYPTSRVPDPALRPVRTMSTVSTSDPRRESHFPAIEKKYGKPMSHWHGVMKSVAGLKYEGQMKHLTEGHGFSRTHANALVMYSRGSATARRHDTPEEYFATLDPVPAATMRNIFSSLQEMFPDLDMVMAWNQPMLKSGGRYVFGASVAAKHILVAPWDADLLLALAPRLKGYTVNKKTIRVPLDWNVDSELLRDLVGPQLDQ
jgi:uncharacterized protein YdhG (YjbR/CyaY superfamily)